MRAPVTRIARTDGDDDMSLMDAGASGASSIGSTLLQLAITLLRDLLRLSARVSGRVANGSLHAAGALLKSAQERANRGQVGLSRFTQLAQSREPVHVTDREVARLLRGELKKHGVTFAVEKHLDGSITYHAEGKDATILAHALEQAQQRVDELNRSRSEAQHRGETITTGDDQHRIDLTEQQAGQLGSELREHAETLRENGRTDDARAAETIAETAEQSRSIPADAETIDLVEDARAAQPGTPDHMQPVQEAINDERATIEAEPYRALIDKSIDPATVQMEQAQVIVPMTEQQTEQVVEAVRESAEHARGQSQAQPEAPDIAREAPAADVDRAAAFDALADDIEINQSIELTPESTQMLHETVEARGWTPGADGGQTPHELHHVIETVENAHTEQQTRTPEAPEQTVSAERGAPAETASVDQAAPIVSAPTQAEPAVATPDAARNVPQREGHETDPFSAHEWGGDTHDDHEPALEQAEAPTVLPPKPVIPAEQAAREAAAKTQQAQPVQSPSTTRDREGAAKAPNAPKPSLGQVVGKIVNGRTDAAKKDAAARQAQRETGLAQGQQAPQMPTGRGR
ncbi:MAG: hypothetical protein ACTH8F_08360 [Microbacterium sp.]|uniref:hypothetical protein n=1 Tax=Microbacterium sp. TaxID=51671 RepID=UPI003F9861FE